MTLNLPGWGGWHDGRVSNALAVDPFRVAFDDGAMADLRERLARSRLALPDGDGWERGVPGRWLSAPLSDWRAFDVARFQARLGRLTHLRANLDGQLVHLVHMPGRGPDPMQHHQRRADCFQPGPAPGHPQLAQTLRDVFRPFRDSH